jgi:hypothetical protein
VLRARPRMVGSESLGVFEIDVTVAEILNLRSLLNKILLKILLFTNKVIERRLAERCDNRSKLMQRSLKFQKNRANIFRA